MVILFDNTVCLRPIYRGPNLSIIIDVPMCNPAKYLIQVVDHNESNKRPTIVIKSPVWIFHYYLCVHTFCCCRRSPHSAHLYLAERIEKISRPLFPPNVQMNKGMYSSN